MAFPAEPLDVIVEMAVGADPDADPDTWSWTDITDWALARTIQITRGKQDRFSTTAPAQARLVLDNTGGRFVARNPSGAYYPNLHRNVPIRISVDPGTGAVPRFTGFVDQLPVSWDVSGADPHVSITASGLLKRLSRRTSQIVSAPRRYIPRTATPPTAYWPLEDGPTALYATPQVGTNRMVPWTGKHPSGAAVTFARWGNGSLGPWLPPAFTFPPSSGLAILVGRVDMPGSPTFWTAAFIYAGATGSESIILDINPGYLDNTVGWPQLVLDPQNGRITTTFNAEPETESATPGLFDGLGHSVRLTAVQSGGNVSWTVRIDGVSVQSDVTSGAMTLPPVFAVGIVSSGSGGGTVGHLAVWAYQPSNIELADACLGWPDEPAGWRLDRLCNDELNIPFVTVGNLPIGDLGDRTQPMGAEPVAAFMALAREVEDVDGGILAEATTGELEYMIGRDRYNRSVDLALDYNEGHLAPPFEPADDDTNIVNDVSASKSGGGQNVARYVDADHVAAEGRYDEDVTVNVADEDQLADQAAWRVHLGTVPELRYPRLTLNLARNPGLIDDWLGCRLGSRITVDNPPAELPPDLIDLHLLGYTETLDPFTWLVEANCEPASPYTLGVWEDTVLGRASNVSELTAGVNSSATSLSVAATEADVWVTTAGNSGEFPFDIRVGGEVMTVTAVADSVNDSFTRTVGSGGWGTGWTGTASQQSVNGSVGLISHDAANQSVIVLANSPSSADAVRAAVNIRCPSVATGASFETGIILRRVDASNYYLANIVWDLSGVLGLTIVRNLAGSFTTLGSVTLLGTYSGSQSVRLTFGIQGSTLRAQAAIVGGSTFSPLVKTDTSHTSGGLGIRSRRNTGNTNGTTAIQYDNWAVLNPQTFTVTRGINGVTSSHSAGDAVALVTPMVAGL